MEGAWERREPAVTTHRTGPARPEEDHSIGERTNTVGARSARWAWRARYRALRDGRAGARLLARPMRRATEQGTELLLKTSSIDTVVVLAAK